MGEVLRHLWIAGRTAEVLRPEVDDAGYDLVIEANGVMRHIQLKSSHAGSTTARVTVHTALAAKPCGCVVWIVFDPASVKLCSYRWFGAQPGSPLPSLADAGVAKHSRANSEGVRAARPNVRTLPKGGFSIVDDVPSLAYRLFGVTDEGTPA